MSDPIEWVNTSKRVTALTGQGTFYAEGKVVAYCDMPQVLILTDDNRLEWWRADMCKEGA